MLDFAPLATVAIVGLSPQGDRPSNQVAGYLQAQGFEIIPVNPAATEILGQPCYPELTAVPREKAIDLVAVFRRPEEVLPVAREAVERGARVLWLPEGVVDQKAAVLAREAGLEVVMDRCLKKAYKAWLAAGDKAVYDVLIIGAGPAGLTAGMYAARSGLQTGVFEGMVPGGAVVSTASIENYPGFAEPIAGAELMLRFLTQAQRFGVELITENVVNTGLHGHLKRVETAGKVRYARTVIIAGGAKARRLGVPGEERFTGRGVSYCATCDGAFFRDKKVVVVGGGNAAVEEALYLTRLAGEVALIHRRDRLRAVRILQERAFAAPKMRFVWDTVVEEIKGNQAVEQVQVRNVKTGVITAMPCDGVFVYIGYSPALEYLADQVAKTPEGYIAVDATMATNVPGVFACGDIRNTPLRQVATAVGDGAIAAAAVDKYLVSRR